MYLHTTLNIHSARSETRGDAESSCDDIGETGSAIALAMLYSSATRFYSAPIPDIGPYDIISALLSNFRLTGTGSNVIRCQPRTLTFL